MTSLYATIAPHFTQDLLSPGLRVGYCDDGGVWQFLAPSLAQRLPLRAIEWRNLVGVTQTIDRLPLKFVARPESEPSLPLVCIYVIKCEDMDRYKATVKAQIAQWIDRMNAAKVDWMLLYVPLGTRAKRGSTGHAGISSGLAGGSGGGSGGRAQASGGIYKRIFEKIKSDFAHKKSASSNYSASAGSGVGGGSSSGGGGASGGASGTNEASLRSSAGGAASSAISNLSNLGSSLAGIGGGGAANGVSVDRICKIDMMEGASVVGAQSTSNEAQWTELLLKLKKCIMEAFQCKCLQYEEDVRVLDAKRSLPNWDFGAFFVAKEKLALMYQQTCLLDDAIRHLDELEAIFGFLVDNDKRFATPTARALTASDPIFTVSALAVDLNAMHQQIASGHASPLLMRLYFFSRQIRTLYLMGDFRQLITRAIEFISSFHAVLQSEQEHSSRGDIKWFQPHLWAAGACLEIAYACELSWSGHDYQISSASIPEGVSFALTPEVMAGLLGDILYLARRVLKKSAMSNGWWTMAPTGDTSEVSVAQPVASSSWYISLETMFEAATPDLFQRCVWEISHLASLHFSRAGRHRFAVFLGGECARYHARHREFESASRLFRSHARQCEEDKWWSLVSDCVKRICDCELALGRSAQAVAACFSMLEIAQASNVEVSRAYLDQLLSSLVQSLEHCEDSKDDEADTDGNAKSHQRGDRVKMGQLIKPAMAIETMQSPSSDLDYGDVRVTLSLTNQFPAGIHIESVRIRFTKCSDDKTDAGGAEELRELEGMTELSLEDSESCESKGMNEDVEGEVAAEEEDDGALVELVENNVYLYERASVNLIFLYGDVDVGRYQCTGLECAVAGNTFPLFDKGDLARIVFEIPPRKSTLQLSIDGPPLLTPASMEEVCITIDSEDDAVHEGVLEIALPDDCGAVALSHAQLHLPSGTQQSSHATDEDAVPSKKCTLAVAELPAHTRVTCSVWLIVASTDEPVVVALAASLRYETHQAGAKRRTELRRSERAFRILLPLVATPRIKRVDASRAFVALALECNSECGVWIRDYALRCDALGDDADDVETAAPSSVQVTQDPNGHLRGHHLAPGDTLHMAFGLGVAITGGCVLPDKAVLRLSIEFDRPTASPTAATATTAETCASWRTDSLVEIPLQSLRGPMYQIHVEPKPEDDPQALSLGDDVTFRVTVQQLQTAPSNATAEPLLLCLDAASEREWVLLGKQHERFCVDAGGQFTATKRLLPLRVGRLRAPQFHLRVPPSSSSVSSTSPPATPSSLSTEPHGAVPRERVFSAQSALTLLVV